MKNISSLLLLIIIYSCNSNSEKFSTKNSILNKSGLFKIEYYKSKNGKAFEVGPNPIFKIENKLELKNAIDEIRNSENPGMWKGAGWNKIKLYFKDTIITISTANSKIGMGNSGAFYSLPKNNFIEKRLNKKK